MVVKYASGWFGAALVGAAALAWVAGACSSTRPVEQGVKAGLAEGVVTLEPAPSPGQFLYRPRLSDLREARETTVSGQRVLLGLGGQRWLFTEKAPLLAAGQLA